MITGGCLAVDVDGTLVTRGVVNRKVLAMIHQGQAQNFDIIIWSRRGRDVAVNAAALAGVTGALCCAKPTHIVDDKGLTWLKDTVVAVV